MSARSVAIPEVRWTYRRAFSFVALALAGWLLHGVIADIEGDAARTTVAIYLTRTIWVVAGFYLCGPSIPDLAHLIAAIRGGPQLEKSQ